jgi:hypothetical protein
MSASQRRFADTLAGQRLSDPESLDQLARLFPTAESASVQAAIAGILIRPTTRQSLHPRSCKRCVRVVEGFRWRRHDRRSSSPADAGFVAGVNAPTLLSELSDSTASLVGSLPNRPRGRARGRTPPCPNAWKLCN